jgi:hypothetical protein
MARKKEFSLSEVEIKGHWITGYERRSRDIAVVSAAVRSRAAAVSEL